jgi:hypothetical protein
MTRSRVDSGTRAPGASFRTNDTHDWDTPANFATSVMVGLMRFASRATDTSGVP